MKCVESKKVETDIYSATFKAKLPSHVLETLDYDSMKGTFWYSHNESSFWSGQRLFILYLQYLLHGRF